MLTQRRQQIPFDASAREIVEDLVGLHVLPSTQRPQLLHVCNVEVADAVVADFAGLVQRDERFQRLRKRHVAAPVQQVQIQLIGSQAPQAPLAGEGGA